MERDDSGQSRHPRCPPSGDVWAYQFCYSNRRPKPKPDDLGAVVPATRTLYEKYGELKKTNWALSLSGMGLFAWMLRNTWVARNSAESPWKFTKLGAIESLLQLPETIQRRQLRELNFSLYSGDSRSVRLWVQRNLPDQLRWWGIATAILNPSPMPFPVGGYRLPSFATVTQLLFLSTAPPREISHIFKWIGMDRAKAEVSTEVFTAVRSRIFINGLWGAIAGLSVSPLLPIHPLVAQVSVAHTVLSSLTLLQNYGRLLNSPFPRPDIHEHLVRVNKATIARLGWTALPMFVVGGVFASAYDLSRTYQAESSAPPKDDRSKY